MKVINIYALGLGSDLQILDNSFLKLKYNLPLLIGLDAKIRS